MYMNMQSYFCVYDTSAKKKQNVCRRILLEYTQCQWNMVTTEHVMIERLNTKISVSATDLFLQQKQ